MGSRSRALAYALLFAPTACGAAAPAPASTPPVAPSASVEPPRPAPIAAPEPRELPTDCAPGQAEGICAPPRSLVDELCNGNPRAGTALALFAKGTPWTRAYLRGAMDGWYTTGRQSVVSHFVFDEEVIVLRHPQAASGGMVIGSGQAPFDVIRWDGACASLGGEEVTLKKPPAPKHAPIVWQHIDDPVQVALLRDDGVAKASAARKKECKGTSTFGMLSAGCAKADDKLADVVVAYVRKGGDIPATK